MIFFLVYGEFIRGKVKIVFSRFCMLREVCGFRLVMKVLMIWGIWYGRWGFDVG